MALLRNLYFTAFLDPCHTKRLLLLVAFFDEIEVTHFKYLKGQHSIRKYAVG
jgi:hypothetical protein